MEVKVDAKNAYLLSKYKWHNCKGYLATNWKCGCGPTTTMTLHKLVLNLETIPEGDCPCDDSYVESGYDIAHINHNKRDCRLQNLEYQLKSFNNSDKPKLARHSSIYTGVCWHKHGGKWISQIKIDDKMIYIGYYQTERDAALARNEYVISHNLVGQYKLNDIPKLTITKKL